MTAVIVIALVIAYAAFVVLAGKSVDSRDDDQ